MNGKERTCKPHPANVDGRNRTPFNWVLFQVLAPRAYIQGRGEEECNFNTDMLIKNGMSKYGNYGYGFQPGWLVKLIEST
jgi:hypothetical protein